MKNINDRAFMRKRHVSNKIIRQKLLKETERFILRDINIKPYKNFLKERVTQ